MTILDVIRQQGPMSSLDFEAQHDVEWKTDWRWGQMRAAKALLEMLGDTGELMVGHRQSARRYYDLAERVLPDGVAAQPLLTDEEEYLIWSDWRGIRMKKSSDFKVGDSVVVKAGITDPDLGTGLGGWQGRISGMATDRGGRTLISIRWDSITLENMPESVIQRCEKSGLDWAEMVLATEKVELATPRDTMNDVVGTVGELAARYAWSYLGEQGRRIRQVLAEVDGDDEMAAWDAWARHLRKNLAFPFEAKVCEVQDEGPLQVGDRVTVKKIFVVDDLYGVIVRVAYVHRKYDFPLCDLDVIDEGSSNYQIVDDYCVWFANR